MIRSECYPKKLQERKASAFALILLFCILFSVFFAAVEAGHDCIGDDCPVCASLMECGEIVQRMKNSLPLFTVCVLMCISLNTCDEKTSLLLPFITPVSLKIQLNN